MSGNGFVSVHCADAHIRKADYRPDIDGLRAIAVLSVIGFHAFPSLVPGGFVGVDIFFVISGFLISGHILADLNSGAFSTTAFYVRRIKRIFPALLLILLICTGIGWIVLTPAEYELMGRPIAGGAGFVANFVFWKEAGYFDAAADTKPLLHLWSLGIEEQFYIVWPFVLGFLWRRTSLVRGWAILGLLSASLAYSLWLVGHDRTADFYSPLSRFWELALGASLAYGALYKRELCAAHGQALSWLGLCLILLAVMLLKSSDPFPGAWALLPTLGAACIIAGQGWLNRRFLASRPLVWVGLISYPLYLWHWPLLSFARVINSETPSIEARLWLLAISVALAWLTYRIIERPVRTRQGRHARKAAVFLGASMFLLFLSGVAIKKLDGIQSRQLSKLNGDVTTLAVGRDRGALQKECGLPGSERDRFQFCLSKGADAPQFAVLGDSKGEALFYGLAREAKPEMRGILIGSVHPPRDDTPANDQQQVKNRLALQTVLNNPSIKVVAFVVALRSTFAVDSETGFIVNGSSPLAGDWIASYSQAIRQLEEAGKRVIFVIDNPTFPDPRSCISGDMTSSPLLNRFLRRKPNPRCSIRYTDHLAGTDAYRKGVAELMRANPRLTVYDPTPLLCDISRNECSTTRNGKFLYSYSDHISDHANSLIARDMLPVVEGLMPGRPQSRADGSQAPHTATY